MTATGFSYPGVFRPFEDILLHAGIEAGEIRRETAHADDEILVRAVLSPDLKIDAIPRRQLSPAFARGFAETLAACAKTPDADLPPATPPRERDPTLHDRASALLKELAPKAEAAHVDPALLATRTDATSYLLDPDDPTHPLNRGWRREVAALH